jgi:UDP-N-acetylglucosamine 2-epimerase (non-hydrolysing)
MKTKLVTLVGTRPEVIKLSQIINQCDNFFDHILIHTGQNYDYELNEIFFKDLKIRKPDYFLDIKSNSLGESIGNIISKSYEILKKINPDCFLVLGDTNSCLSTISAKRLKIPIFHMEAGNRCFDQNVPEEINRKIVDHISDINLTYTENARKYLLSEGIRKDFIFNVGSPMKEILESNQNSIQSSKILNALNLEKGNYIVVSLHREENVDNKENFINILNSLEEITIRLDKKIIFSTHPRTKNRLNELSMEINTKIEFIKPLGFFDYISLQLNSFVVLSDSGTLAEETAILKFPAVSLRTSTERPEAIDSGSLILGSLDEKNILNSIDLALNTKSNKEPDDYNKTNCSDKVVKIIQSYTSIVNREVWKR